MSRQTRPQVHYTARATWLNDPNGLIHHEGVWHLFYQSNPHGNVWGNISWGHAVSSDLLHWEEIDVALTATEEVHYFSGSCVFDRDNTSGFGRNGVAPLVAVFTEHYMEVSPRFGTQAQGLAYSLDGGHSFTPYAHNPVLSRDSSDFRDPKVSWVADFGYWLMVAVEATQNIVTFYRSDNLVDWTLLSEFGPANAKAPTWECPDLFPLHVDGTGEKKWVLVVSVNPGALYGGSGVQYFVGDFDGTTFTAPTTDSTDHRDYNWVDHGADYYAPVTFNDTPDGRRIAIGWMNNWSYAGAIPTDPWRGSMSIPRELSLVEQDGRLTLRQRPVRELDAAASTPLDITDSDGRPTVPIGGAGLIDLRVTGDATVGLGAATLTYAGGLLTLTRNDSSAINHPEHSTPQWTKVTPVSETLDLSVLVDAGSVEVSAADGRFWLTSLVDPAEEIRVTLSPGVAVERAVRVR